MNAFIIRHGNIDKCLNAWIRVWISWILIVVYEADMKREFSFELEDCYQSPQSESMSEFGMLSS